MNKSSADIWRMSASQQAAAIKAQEFSVTEATQSALDRMAEVNPQLNAVVEDLGQEALSRASMLDNLPADQRGPLHGVTATIKINVDQTGQATSNGVPALRNLIAPDNAPVVRNLLDAGAVIIGRTNTPEFSFRADTDNPLYGRTHNPWGRHISAGGSSGGAGAAVMSGIGALAHGNDIGGSLRFPAAATGAVTVKPGLGRVPAWNPSQKSERGLLAQSMSVQGLIVRSASDLELAMPSLIAGDVRDPFHVPLPWDGPKLDGVPKIGFTKQMYGFDLHPEVDAALDAARAALEAAGHDVIELDIPNLRACAELGYRALMGEVKTLMAGDVQSAGSDTIQQIFATYFKLFPPIEGDALIAAMAQRSHYARQWNLLLDQTPLIVTPFMPAPFFAPNRDTEGDAGVTEVLGSAIWSYSMNFLGLPAGTVPARIAKLPSGPQPINVQIVGRRWREDLIVQACRVIEAHMPPVAPALWAHMQD
jgi:amidase